MQAPLAPAASNLAAPAACRPQQLPLRVLAGHSWGGTECFGATNAAGVFLGLVAPYLGRNISWALVAITCVMIVVTAVALSLTAFRDPGYIPRSGDDPDCG